MFPALPIVSHLEEIAALLVENPVVLLSSPPGTGKTTVLPPFLLAKRKGGNTKRIALLEPRRIAAVRTAEFIAAEYLSPPERCGATVGYKVRGESKVGSDTKLEVMTYGVFNRIAASEIDLVSFDLIIFDEAHERSIDIDLALAQALEIQASLRPDLRILVMSATLNVDDIKSVAPAAPLVSVTSPSYPVELSYLPATLAEERKLETHVVRATRTVNHLEGDILIFLPGAAEITRAADALTQAIPEREVVTLFGELSLADQRAILNPPAESAPRIIVATSIAETSLTVPRVHTVIDAGLSRVPRYDAERGLPGLATVRVSSSTAEQRAGRAGRLGPGRCIRLWPAHEQLVRFRSPEILESDLSPLLLTLASAGVRDHRTLKWMTKPLDGAVIAAKELLVGLGALKTDGGITPHGTQMQALPVHPRLAHMVITAAQCGEGELGCRLAAVSSEMRPSAQNTIVDLNSLVEISAPTGTTELFKTLRRTIQGLPKLPGKSNSSENITPALLFAAAFPDRIAHRRGEREYLLSGGPRALLPIGSPLAREEWLVCPAVRYRSGVATASISAAAPVTENALRAFVPQLFSAKRLTAWNPNRKAVVDRQVERLGAIEITAQETPSNAPESAKILLTNITFTDLPISKKSLALIERAKWLSQFELFESQTGRWWQSLEDKGLFWLEQFIPSATRLSDISEDAVHFALVNAAGGEQTVQKISKLAPSSITLPRGRTVELEYSQNKAPVAASRLQDFFGTTTHPTVGGGKIAVICELLSPAKRPVQVTDDLPRFWKGSYAEVRKELKSRYPKHDWPEKP